MDGVVTVEACSVQSGVKGYFEMFSDTRVEEGLGGDKYPALRPMHEGLRLGGRELIGNKHTSLIVIGNKSRSRWEASLQKHRQRDVG